MQKKYFEHHSEDEPLTRIFYKKNIGNSLFLCVMNIFLPRTVNRVQKSETVFRN